ncbi:murein biosynthesis integral membrane protein MurJ [Rhizobium sp. C4]|uniref:murein biosynthesis integral membrane protein MurJ n=1 Tax=Rhizobium sp. C4 TaxID=1349800 RepID=UPI001E4AA493|nr:murein biosynthesis integral membrane protein MurJ [Rhizobium sp. C4]MCD2175372.1 murein biosynthesis integral membrane protein MurJ [Rhizobium sp. C4]
MSLFKKFVTVGGGTLGSRLMGFARETMMAAALGTGPMAEAFYAAFKLPNLFRRLFAEGAFNAAFVPLFAKEIEAGGIDGAKRFSEEVFGVLFTVLLALTVVMELAMPLLMRTIIAPGFEGDKYDITVRLAVIMFPYLACMSLTAMLSGMLNSLHHYLAAAIAPIFFNVAMIAALAYGIWIKADGVTIAYYLSYAVLVAGILQMLVLYVGVRHAGMSIAFRRPHLTPKVKRLLALALPAAVIGGVTQINLIIGQAVASMKEGAIASLQYADRIYQLPLGVVGVAVGVVLLPELARALKSKHMVEAESLQNRSIEFVLFLTLPAAAGIFALSDEIIRLVYERGAFHSEATATVAAVLTLFGFGLPGFVLNKALTPGFFAREDTKTPMRFTMISVVVNSVLAISLFPFFAERGIAIAETTAGWLSTIMLFTTLQRRGHLNIERSLVTRAIRMAIASVIMAVAAHYMAAYFADYLRSGSHALTQAAVLLPIVFASFLLYLIIVFAIGGADLGMIRRNMKRRGKAAPPIPDDPA